VRIAVVGATGFIGRHVVAEAIKRGHDVIATGRSINLSNNFSWSNDIQYLPLDIREYPENLYSYLEKPDCVIFLVWPNLYGYQELFQVEENLPLSYKFIKTLILSGLQNIVVAGTCYEYGKVNGELTEDLVPQPTNAYGIAKDSLRRMLELLQTKYLFSLRWARLFYIYGKGQNSNSLIPQLLSAIERGDENFSMSGGEQLRDFLKVEECASMLVDLSELGNKSGIFNCASGSPISVRSFIESLILQMNSKITLNLAAYPYRSDEAMAFWGSNEKIKSIRQRS
jgi:dTDP-6-deoxy-L-talose 4-dehydrogenase (NAD+)